MTDRVERRDEPVPIEAVTERGCCDFCGAELTTNGECSARCAAFRRADEARQTRQG